KPVMFRYKKEIDPAGTQQFGLVAEDVERINTDLVVRDENGKVNSVRYEQVNAMLLNEFLKARRQIDVHQKQIDALTAGLRATTVQRALRRLCEECERKGRLRVFEVLSPYLSAERDDLSYPTLATRLHVPESFVKKLIYRMRQRYRVLLREEVRQTVADPAEVDEELRHLCGSLAASSAYAA
ncbi:MAG TPA: hypothetical protein VIR01_05195, partial [Pyrinomonadaceae bacterium]